MIKMKNLAPSVRSRIVGHNYPCRQWHVCMADAVNADYLYDNLENGQLVHDPNVAAEQAQAFEHIIVWPGYYNMTTPIALNADGMKLMAALMGPEIGLSYATRLWATGDAAIEIQGAKGVEVAGFRIGPEEIGCTGIDIGTTANSYGAYIHDNTFFHEQAENMCTHIDLGVASTYHSDESLIMNNNFIHGGANSASYAQIMWNLSIRSKIIGNTFMQVGGSTNYQGIKVTAGVEQGQILNNKFLAFESGTIAAIAVGATTVGHLYIDGNEFIGHTANANCFDYDTNNAGRNYLNGVLIDS